MNVVTQKLINVIGPTVVENIISAILTDEKLTSFKDNVITFFRRTADRTATEVDDNLVEFAINMIMEPGKSIEHTRELCGLLRGYIQDSRTELDDIMLLPILNRIEQLGTSEPEK